MYLLFSPYPGLLKGGVIFFVICVSNQVLKIYYSKLTNFI